MRVPDDSGGLKTKCPKCGRRLRVPTNRPTAPRPAGAPVRTAGVVPAVDEVVLDDDSVDLVKDVASGSLPAATAESAAELDLTGLDDIEVIEEEPAVDDVMVVEDDLPINENVEVLEEDASAVDDVVVVEDKPSPLAIPAGADPFAGHDIPDSMLEDVRAELTKSEKIVWVGRPSMTLMKGNANVAVGVGAVLALVGLGLLVGIAFASVTTQLIAFAVIGPVLTALGVLLLFTRMWVSRGAKWRSVYLLTNRRTLIFNGKTLGKVQMKSYTVARVKDMQREDSNRLKGSGDIIFEAERVGKVIGPTTLAGNDPRRGSHSTRSGVHEITRGFLMIENVKAVEKLIRETLVDRGVDKSMAR
jgi:hypothetical protein